MFYKKGGGDIWSILTLNNVFGENGENARRGGGVHLFPQHNSNLSPKMVIFGEDQKCSWGPKMKNKVYWNTLRGIARAP